MKNKSNQEMNKTRTRKVFLKSEDEYLIKAMIESPFISWKEISKKVPGRTGRQCRERWLNYLSPSIEQKGWNEFEDVLLIEKVKQFGTKWKFIINFFPTRSYNNIKNRYYSHLKRFIETENHQENILLPKINNIFDLLIKEIQENAKIKWEFDEYIFKENSM